MEKASLPFFVKLAKAGQLLFWVSLVYVVFVIFKSTLLSAFYPMNPIARSTEWGIFKWHFPAIFHQITLVLPLIFLYLFQSNMAKGCKNLDWNLIEKGQRYLLCYLFALTIMAGLNLILESLI